MHWVIQNDLYSEEGHASLIRALEAMGLPFSLVKVVPFVHTLEPEPTIPDGSKVIALGAYTLITIAKNRGWSPGTYDLLDVAVTHDEISEQYGHEPHGFKIVETNTLNAAGWYRGNVGKIVDALERLEGKP